MAISQRRAGGQAEQPAKYVVSATLAYPAWNNSTVLKGDLLNEVPALKQHIDGDIVIAGSFQLARTLIEHEPMRLLGTQTLESGIAYLTYQPVRDASGIGRRQRSEMPAGASLRAGIRESAS